MTQGADADASADYEEQAYVRDRLGMSIDYRVGPRALLSSQGLPEAGWPLLCPAVEGHRWAGVRRPVAARSQQRAPRPRTGWSSRAGRALLRALTPRGVRTGSHNKGQ